MPRNWASTATVRRIGAGIIAMRLTDRRSVAARSFIGPEELVDEHSAGSHLLVPGVIHQVFGLAIAPKHDGIVTWAEDLARNGAQDARARFVAGVRVRSHNLLSHTVIDSVS